ncbi:hypothetical protein FQN50_000906 [Emmonsiellopsis sp. PD_5]|nr:hypothetical protein FQN50_000906 [Emmonsiellopsis sp. PD_5]
MLKEAVDHSVYYQAITLDVLDVVNDMVQHIRKNSVEPFAVPIEVPGPAPMPVSPTAAVLVESPGPAPALVSPSAALVEITGLALVPKAVKPAINTALALTDVSTVSVNANGDLQDQEVNKEALKAAMKQACRVISKVWKDETFQVPFGGDDEVQEAQQVDWEAGHQVQKNEWHYIKWAEDHCVKQEGSEGEGLAGGTDAGAGAAAA